MQKKGYLSFVLHAHLPFIHHPESDDYLEESWLYEAISETYIPLLQYFQKLVDEGMTREQAERYIDNMGMDMDDTEERWSATCPWKAPGMKVSDFL